MKTRLEQPVQYLLVLGDHEVPLNQYLGRELWLEYGGEINCIHCARKTRKSFNQGYCYPCFRSLARCDSCIMSPEKCHYAAGTCREPEWGEQHCMIDHFVYLANTSGLKVGITRGSQVPTRWIDQGATQAQPIFRVSTRFYSGLVEDVLRSHITDRTQWQAMLKGDAEPCDLDRAREELLAQSGAEIAALQRQYGLQAITSLESHPQTLIGYPVLQYPTRVKSFNLDKSSRAGGTLLGIKGQYLIFDGGVINMRKYGGYQLSLTLN
ncbi:MAG: DUF2797 domain-containing protein [Halieaceae bacterium]|nr:DUF2797 domain-containing protein [Halieaceae bacterium]MCP5163907.1 DUF2797 domain-containing protein [Pseudomonadales bacterium]MCP5202957.1 DUF2797 domain-containing protein [Pseudomonadales bacterium]